MPLSGIWSSRIREILDRIVELAWVMVIYFSSEATIWGLSRVMAPAGIQFFASILGMVIIFGITTAALYLWRRSFDEVYHRWIKSKVSYAQRPWHGWTQVSLTLICAPGRFYQFSHGCRLHHSHHYDGPE